MGRLILVPNAPAGDNPYRARFAACTIDELSKTFNADTRSMGFTTSRGLFLIALREAFLATGLDCSSFIDAEGMSMNHQIALDGRTLVLVPTPEQGEH